MRGWDKGIDYETTYSRILRKITSVKRDTTRCYLIIALIQLRNGARISEAIRGFKEWIKTSKTEVYIQVSKKKRHEERLIVIPHEVHEYKLSCVDLLDLNNRVLRDRVRAILYYYFKINTHSLRYAFITYLLRNGVNPALVSKLIRHSRLDTLMHYVQTKQSDEILRKMG
jgi:site-specific recombinase XerD